MGCQNLYSLGSRRESHPLCWPGSRLNYSDLEMRTQTITTHCGYVAVVHAKLNQGGTVFRFRSRGMSPDTYSNTRSVRPSAIRSSNVRFSKIPGTRTLGILLWKKTLAGGLNVHWSESLPRPDCGSDTTGSLTSRRGNVGSPALRARLDPFGRDIERAQSR